MSDYTSFSHFLRDRNFRISGAPLAPELMISSDGDFITFYAPFDYINPVAKIVICGLTPGLQQATNALNTLMSSLQSGDSDELALRRAKEVASFSGPMRSNLIAMLDHVGIHHVLGIDSCADLFGSKSHLVHYTSALRNPVFKDGVNYSGAPSMIKQPMLLRQIEEVLAEEIRSLAPDCLYVPLGDEVSKAFLHLESKGIIDAAAVFHGFPHPSPASNERIHYFLGRKERHLLSSKTNPEKIDSNKQSIISKVNAISASKVTNRLHDIA